MYIKTFVNNVGKELAKNGKNRVGVASFAEKAKREISCSVGPINYGTFSMEVDKIERYGEYTNLQAGLEKADRILNEPGCELTRPGRHIILLVSDGNGNYGSYDDLVNAAAAIRDTGVQIFSIGIRNTHYKEYVLEEISGGLDYVKPVDGFENLQDIDFAHIMNKISCTPKVKTTAKPKTTKKTTTTKKPTTTTEYITTTKEPTTTTEHITTTEEPTTTTEYITTTEEPTTTTEHITTTEEPTTTTEYITTTTEEPTTTTEAVTTTTEKKIIIAPKPQGISHYITMK